MTFRPTRKDRRRIRIKEKENDRPKDVDKPKESDRPTETGRKKETEDRAKRISVSYRAKQKQKQAQETKPETGRRTRVRVRENEPMDKQPETESSKEKGIHPETKTPGEKDTQPEKKSTKEREPQSEMKTPKEKERQPEKKSTKEKERQSETKTPQEPRMRETKRKEVKREKERPDPTRVDAMVKEIAKDYDKKMKETGNVDLWGRPAKKLDEGKLRHEITRGLQEKGTKEKTPAIKEDGQKQTGDLSKAIGKKFAEKLGSVADKATGKIKDSGRDDTKRKPEQKGPKESKERVKPIRPTPTESNERLGPKNRLRFAKVRDVEITTDKQLQSLLQKEYQTLMKRGNFHEIYHQAIEHMKMVKKYDGREHLPHGVVSEKARALGLDPETVGQWARGNNPGLYKFMNWSIPTSEASERVEKILSSNNGIRNESDVRARFDNYYLGHEERKSHFCKREETKSVKYYEFLERYQQGGIHLDIAKEVGLSDSGARAYLEGATPRWVGLAGQTPSETPRHGYNWLPKKYEHGGHGGKWSDWIQVPEEISDCKQIKEVLSNLEPLDNADMRKWEKKFGQGSQEESFMYLLGAYVSDSRVPSSSTSSIAFGINLSKGYEWSKDYGEACCHSLGKIGIKAHRVSDKEPFTSKIETPSGVREIKGKAQYEWMSEVSPVLRWMRRSCLGYDDSAKTYQSMSGNWMLNAPEKMRLGFLRGLSDGDGGVSSRGYYFAISTHSNHAFVQKLLGSFDVETHRSKTYVRTSNFASVKKVADVQPFTHARSRISALEKTVRMIESRRHNIQSNPPSKDEISFMIRLRKTSMSYGEIGEKLFDKYGYTLDARNIRKLIIRDKRIKEE